MRVPKFLVKVGSWFGAGIVLAEAGDLVMPFVNNVGWETGGIGGLALGAAYGVGKWSMKDDNKSAVAPPPALEASRDDGFLGNIVNKGAQRVAQKRGLR